MTYVASYPPVPPSSEIKAIETRYAGCFFRSRLEARWAVFFDAMGVPWDYEPERHMVGHVWKRCAHQDECACPERQLSYLPGFFLPRSGTWVEVKGDIRKFDRQLLAESVDWGVGLPGTVDSAGTHRGLLLLGSIPRPHPYETPVHPILQHHKGGFVNMAWFEAGGFLCVDQTCYDTYFDSTSDGLRSQSAWGPIQRQWSERPYVSEGPAEPEMLTALAAARSARFEEHQ